MLTSKSLLRLIQPTKKAMIQTVQVLRRFQKLIKFYQTQQKEINMMLLKKLEHMDLISLMKTDYSEISLVEDSLMNSKNLIIWRTDSSRRMISSKFQVKNGNLIMEKDTLNKFIKKVFGRMVKKQQKPMSRRESQMEQFMK